MISIITPTYNREKELKRVYNSLIKQTNKDFEWVVVDDGSTDKTEDLINKFIKENKIIIKYLKKENGGKPSAYNLGVKNSSGDLIICLDSDDILSDKAIEIITNDYEEITNEKKIAGLVYNTYYINEKDKIIGTSLLNNIIDTYYNIYEKYQVKGDKAQVIKKEIAIKYPFPIINNEKFIPEALVNNRISLKYKFLYKDSLIMGKEYLDNGYSANYFNLVKKNPLGNAIYFKELYNLKKSLYNTYGYVLFSIYGKVKLNIILNEHPNKIGIILIYIPTWIISKWR